MTLRLLDDLRYDVVVLDIGMPGMDGLKLGPVRDPCKLAGKSRRAATDPFTECSRASFRQQIGAGRPANRYILGDSYKSLIDFNGSFRRSLCGPNARTCKLPKRSSSHSTLR